jgi:hypothetical protein
MPSLLSDILPSPFVCHSAQQQLSTFALTIFPYEATIRDVGKVAVEFWDTAGQDAFDTIVSFFV